jgi:phosphatidate phosphatase PAH1
MRKPELFKMACLRDIQRLFGESARNPFYAGFGNRITDALSYRSVNVPSARIFTIDSSGEVKMELLELAGYKSSYVIILLCEGAISKPEIIIMLKKQLYPHDGPCRSNVSSHS